MDLRFKMLRLFANIQMFMGVIFLVAAGFAVLVVFGVITNVDDKLAAAFAGYLGVPIVIALTVTGIGSIAYGQFLYVVMQIEENTRPQTS